MSSNKNSLPPLAEIRSTVASISEIRESQRSFLRLLKRCASSAKCFLRLSSHSFSIFFVYVTATSRASDALILTSAGLLQEESWLQLPIFHHDESQNLSFQIAAEERLQTDTFWCVEVSTA